MKINSVNGKTVITLDEDEALIQYDGKTEIQKQQLSNGNYKNNGRHVFALYSKNDDGFLDVNCGDYSKYNVVKKSDAYENIRNEYQYLHMGDMFSAPFYFGSSITATHIANRVMLANHSMKVKVVEFGQETGLIIKIY